jgi:2-polyprenyl-6-methoxyphenol hydroxylase-like FAD-dependent oxidoreductase
VRIAVLGAGPAGLLFALLAKRRNPSWTIDVADQNPAGATYGFGVVFSAGALAFLERDAPALSRTLAAAMEHWPIQRIVHRAQPIDIDGNGFSAIARLRLLEILGGLCAGAGVTVRRGGAVASLAALGDADLVVGADGWNSLVRRSLADRFAPAIETLDNRFAWYGTRRAFECLTLTFRESAHGPFVAHHYRYAPDMSTFIVECDAATWERAGLGTMSDAESRACCERVFADDLGGAPLVSNRSVWRRFPLVSNRVWWTAAATGHAVLIGDALRTVHFSIGSGTRLALEDAIALDRAFCEAGDDVPAALAAFERERRPVVEKLLAAANASSRWYERFPAKMSLDPLSLAYDYMTRSGRMTAARLRQTAPKFMKRFEDARRS